MRTDQRLRLAIEFRSNDYLGKNSARAQFLLDSVPVFADWLRQPSTCRISQMNSPRFRRRPFLTTGCLLSIVACLPTLRAADAPRIEHVIHISVDGLRPDAITTWGPAELPGFYRMRRDGLFTDNARADYHNTTTVPNHTTQITGRPVLGDRGHGWAANDTTPPSFTIHVNKGSYVASVFDVVHDHGLRTGAFISKPKLLIYKTSFNAASGAPDTIGEDNGPAKIDKLSYISVAEELTDSLLKELRAAPPNYSFLHFREPDQAGHGNGWSLDRASPYMASIKSVDTQLSRLLEFLAGEPKFAGNTVVILTADHGGMLGLKKHDVPADPQNYTIPFYVWGAGVKPGDLYDANEGARRNPGVDRPDYTTVPQPIRNGDAPNLGLSLLRIPTIPGSTINSDGSLRVQGVP